MFAGLILLMLVLRNCIDIIFPEEKPMAAVAVMMALAAVLTAWQLLQSKLSRTEVLLCLALICVSTANVLWIPGKPLPQLYFNIQVIFPIVLLLVFSRADSDLLSSARRLFARLGVPILCTSLAIFSIRQPAGQDLITYLNENPFHVVAQTIAKASIVLVDKPLALPVLAVIVLGIFNVRSALLGYTAGLVMERREIFFSRRMIALYVILFIALLIYATQFEAFLQRLIWRDRTFLEADLSNVSSGRTEIWSYYLNILAGSNLLELFLGNGAVWLYGGFPLMAHNDVLNILVSYGIIGSAIIALAWYIILSRMDPRYRIACIMLFLVLFVTNGVVFHQSNVLFMLYLAGVRRPEVYRVRSFAPVAMSPVLKS
jgi:hypothetical protein